MGGRERAASTWEGGGREGEGSDGDVGGNAGERREKSPHFNPELTTAFDFQPSTLKLVGFQR